MHLLSLLINSLHPCFIIILISLKKKTSYQPKMFKQKCNIYLKLFSKKKCTLFPKAPQGSHLSLCKYAAFTMFWDQNATLHFYLVFHPAVGDLWSAPVSQHIVFHALHTGVLSDFRAKWRFIVLNLCKDTHTRRSDNLTYDLSLYDSMKNHCWRAFGREKYWVWKLEESPEWGKERMFQMLWLLYPEKTP